MTDHRKTRTVGSTASAWRRISCAALLLTWVGCDAATAPDPDLLAHVTLTATVSPLQAVAASSLDRWRISVARTGGGVLVDEEGSVSAGEAQITGQFSLLLESPCEVLAVTIELSAGGEVWYRAHRQHEVCSGTDNTLPVQELDFVRPQPEVGPLSLRLNLTEGQQTSTSFQIRYTGQDGLEWNAAVSPGADWLSLPVASGDLVGSSPLTVEVEVDATGLTPGLYETSITLSAAGFPTPVGVVLVGLTVRAAPRVSVAPLSLDWSAVLGIAPEDQAFTVTNAGGSLLNWTAASDVTWLDISPASGTLGASASEPVTVSVVNLPTTAGVYDGRITVADPDALDSPRTVDVTLRLLDPAAIGLDRTSVIMTTPAGLDAPDATVALSNTGGLPLVWTATSDASWLTVSPAAGTLGPGATSTPLTLSAASASLPSGGYSATVTIVDPEASNSPRTVTVALTVDPPAAPTLTGLSAVLRVLNDSTCANVGSRYDLSLDYDDPNGDVPVSGGRLQGTPLAFDFQFLPNGLSGSTQFDADTNGDGFAGTLTFDLCIAFQVPQNTGVDLTYRLRDALNLWSLPVNIVIPRPPGANTPPPPGG